MNNKPTNTNDSPRSVSLALLGLAAVAAGVIAWYLTSSRDSMPPVGQPLQTEQALLMPEFRPLKPFSLTTHKGADFDNQSLLGQWTFISFGYTHCPDICPTTMSMFAEMHNEIQLQEPVEPYQVAFVSVDPERDSPQRLAEYVSYFDPSFLGITGPEEALQALTKPLGVLHRRVETEDSAMGYVMDHSASIFLLDPKGRFHAYFSPPHDAEKMARDFMAISNRSP
ncbi:MAG: SCO family protein [Candidatus Thiodiazotropha sp.]|nr:SCO family protein [Candidatus Thiodiazotropha taylori]PUB78869.1 MAG: SCO family protein [gamma proteobacterium symbiont of Ctena orbiculata]